MGVGRTFGAELQEKPVEHGESAKACFLSVSGALVYLSKIDKKKSHQTDPEKSSRLPASGHPGSAATCGPGLHLAAEELARLSTPFSGLLYICICIYIYI